MKGRLVQKRHQYVPTDDHRPSDRDVRWRNRLRWNYMLTPNSGKGPPDQKVQQRILTETWVNYLPSYRLMSDFRSRRTFTKYLALGIPTPSYFIMFLYSMILHFTWNCNSVSENKFYNVLLISCTIYLTLVKVFQVILLNERNYVMSQNIWKQFDKYLIDGAKFTAVIELQTMLKTWSPFIYFYFYCKKIICIC